MTGSYVYAATVGPYVKIGTTRDMCHRLGSLTSGRRHMRPADVAHGAAAVYLGHLPGGAVEERAVHHQLREHRVVGEWFTRHPDVMAWVRMLDVTVPPGPPHAYLRVSDAADQWVTARARAHNTSRSVVLRAMLSVATAHPEHVDAKIEALTELETP